eukprot:4966117-Pyramimonas_sp.AAC.1
MAMMSGKPRAIRHPIMGGVIRAGTRTPAQAARSARDRVIREFRELRLEGSVRGETRISATSAQ